MNAEEAYLNGDNYTAALEAVNMFGAISRALPVCNIGGVTAMVARGVSLVNGVANVVSAINAIKNGDTFGAIENIGYAALNFYAAGRACFTGEFCQLVDGGFRRWDQTRRNQPIDTCDENNPRGGIVSRLIQEMHTTWARILHLVANGKTIRTTAEHPFFVWGKGWIPCWKLQPGDELHSHNNVRVFVEGVYDSGVVEKVYNCRVEEHHTYFVGKPDWGFTVWAHNAYDEEVSNKKTTQIGKPIPRPKYAPTDGAGEPLPLPKKPGGAPLPESSNPHTQIGWQEGRRGGYIQTREFGADGAPVKTVDWTDHGRPGTHADPHVHDYLPSPTGGTPQYGPARPPLPGELGGG